MTKGIKVKRNSHRHISTGLVLLGCGWLAASSAWAQGFGGFGGFGGGTSSRSSRSSTTYPSSTQIGSATFSTDPETRKLVVVTDEETAKYISMVVSNLDRPAPQVLIKVVFLEVTHRKGSDIGVEGAYVRRDNAALGSVLQNFKGLPGIDSGNAAATFVGSDFVVTLRAIAEAGKLEVLSRPSVLARNNQEAYINVGQEVPLITSVRYDNFGNQINGYEYRDIGIILRVTPFITSDGMVEMIVSPEISNLSDKSVSISSSTNSSASAGAPVINKRSADTVVVTPDGQTVVIGGLMQNRKTESVSKVPVLGDIPFLGAAFRKKVQSDEKTELLIFLTPHIVTQAKQLAAMTAGERSSLQVAPKSFSEQELDRFLETVPTKSAEPPKKDEKGKKK